MHRAENKNAPSLSGWLIAVAAGLVAFVALVIIGNFDIFPAAAMAGGIAVVAGLVLGMPWGAAAPELKPRVRKIVPAAMPVATVAPVEPAAPVAEAVVSAPAAFVSAPAGTPVSAPAPAAPKAAAKPKVVKAKTEGPVRLKAARKGKADDLKEIEGIGPAMEKLVNGMGFYHFDQIASWSDADVALVDSEMKTFKGRISRDKWVAQAKIIVTEGLEAFRERAKTNNY